ncbi:hypothetical protein Q4598_06990 [Phaeobacter inhibens]|uniref:hypothetical protein n=1 Tax=Phaeobacter inhibens TaxID=221822 RepID=UPI0026E12EEC|nr:hypothetical protein [Phaeobacter inhibens]MDO6755969.1 hypothetical protein [Phaeobacter inhibens]
MDHEDVVSLTGLDTICRYQELTKIADKSLQNYAAKTRELFGPVAKSFDDDKNAEWLIRSYLALKFVLASTVLGTSAKHADNENLKITLPYLNYYTMLNCARAFIFTLPCIEWRDEKSIEMTHQNIINTAGDKLRRVDGGIALAIKSRLLNGQKQRELFSYRFPATGLSVFKDDLIMVEEAIETARFLAELAQFNLSCLEAAVRKHTELSFKVGGQDNLWDLMRYNTKTQELIDDDDYHRVGYFVRKYRYPSELVSLGTHGLLEDFFGAWVSEDETSQGYNPDEDWNLLLDFP